MSEPSAKVSGEIETDEVERTVTVTVIAEAIAPADHDWLRATVEALGVYMAAAGQSMVDNPAQVPYRGQVGEEE